MSLGCFIGSSKVLDRVLYQVIFQLGVLFEALLRGVFGFLVCLQTTSLLPPLAKGGSAFRFGPKRAFVVATVGRFLHLLEM